MYESDPKYQFVRNATEAPTTSLKRYDYIIVGGGTAGCPLAATLSQKYSVLLLERGGSPYGDPLLMNVAGFYPNIEVDTPTSSSQSFISEDGVPNQRARVLGGGSSINAGFFTEPSPDFLDGVNWDPALANSSFYWAADKVAQFPTLKKFQVSFWISSLLLMSLSWPRHVILLSKLIVVLHSSIKFSFLFCFMWFFPVSC